MERAADQSFSDSWPFPVYEEYEECFCEAAPRVKYSAPVSDEFSLVLLTSPSKTIPIDLNEVPHPSVRALQGRRSVAGA